MAHVGGDEIRGRRSAYRTLALRAIGRFAIGYRRGVEDRKQVVAGGGRDRRVGRIHHDIAVAIAGEHHHSSALAAAQHRIHFSLRDYSLIVDIGVVLEGGQLLPHIGRKLLHHGHHADMADLGRDSKAKQHHQQHRYQQHNHHRAHITKDMGTFFANETQEWCHDCWLIK